MHMPSLYSYFAARSKSLSWKLLEELQRCEPYYAICTRSDSCLKVNQRYVILAVKTLSVYCDLYAPHVVHIGHSTLIKFLSIQLIRSHTLDVHILQRYVQKILGIFWNIWYFTHLASKGDNNMHEVSSHMIWAVRKILVHVCLLIWFGVLKSSQQF